MIDPFEEVPPVEPVDPLWEITSRLSRSTMWDMAGPYRMRDEPIKLGQSAASVDVLEREAVDMWERKRSTIPFAMDFGILCHLACESASTLFLAQDELVDLPEEEKMKFKATNEQLGTAVAQSVVGHLFQNGLIKYGG